LLVQTRNEHFWSTFLGIGQDFSAAGGRADVLLEVLEVAFLPSSSAFPPVLRRLAALVATFSSSDDS
jgi:hypothetical protein